MFRMRIAPLLVLLAGCSLPTTPSPLMSLATPPSSSGDAAASPAAPEHDAGDPATADASVPPATDAGGACPAIQPTTGASHNAGDDCLSCHTTISDVALRWTVAGTLWSDAYASSARAGATVTVVDSAGLSVTLVTDVNGNFYTTKTVKLPLHSTATGCTTQAMTEATPNGSCNSAGCHALTQPMYVY